jgi:hypothetical protein
MSTPTFPSRDKWRCEHCLFYDDYGPSGICRKEPPLPQLGHQWPRVTTLDYCGSFVYQKPDRSARKK